ncbi:T9SS type A sorting domain-containing protein, partial [Flavobacterium sp. LB3P122]|uniref:T9SS type A sorting domain-containing protein n=1 Tax=Flavobacterium algoriphilum TaxID=3398738 RepID=UPI003A8BA19C
NYQISPVFANLASGSYNVTVNDALGCTSAATPAVLLSAPPASVAIVYAGVSFCTTTTTAAVTLTGTGGGTFSSTAGLTINGTTGLITPSASLAGTYVVTYTIAASASCPAVVANKSVTITAAPTATIVYAGASFCTTVATAVVTLTGTGTYLGGTFSSTGGLIINGTTGLITPSTSVAGTYVVTYTIAASAGCLAVVANTSVSIESCYVAEGCTLGYWKNHTNRWCSTYTHSMLFGSVFTNAPSLANLTLLQALNLDGGGIYNLARQGVAALLNACSDEVDYPEPYSISPQLVINAVNAAFLTGGKAPGALATQLNILNNSGCPLGGTRATKNSKEADFTAYPIPFKESITIRYDFDYITNAKIEIFDALGVLLMTYDDSDAYFNKEVILHTRFSHSEAQIFFIKVITNKGAMTKKIISSK